MLQAAITVYKSIDMRGVILQFIVTVYLSGCATSPYPENWPANVSATPLQCPDLTGSYENFGNWSDGDRFVLARLFFPLGPSDPLMNNYELLAVSHVTIDRRGDDSHAIKAWVGNELLMERVLAVSELKCLDGRYIYHDTSLGIDGVAPFLPVFHHSSIDRLFSVATDGSLIIENHEFTMGVGIVIPLAVNAKYWYKFPRTSPVSPGFDNNDNIPRGVRTGTAPVIRLLPPEGAPKWSGYKDAGACLDLAAESEEKPDPQAMMMLEGRTTQAFIVQDGMNGKLLQHGSVVGSNWIPTTHRLRIEKQYWESPSITDRYVVCLLNKGYQWDKHNE